MENHQAGGLDFRGAVSNHGLDQLPVGQFSTGCYDTVPGPCAHEIESSVADADPAHTVMDTAGTQPFLGNDKPVALFTQKILLRHTAVLIEDLGMTEIAFSRVPHDRDIAHQVEALGIRGYDNHAGLKIGRRFGIGNGHDNGKGGAVGGTGIPFVAVDHVIIPVFDSGGLHHHGVGTGHVHFGHGKTAADFSRNQGLQEFL